MDAGSPDSAMRAGPRPLALHLAMAQALWTSSQTAWPLWSAGLLPLSPALDGAARRLRDRLGGAVRAEDVLPEIERAARLRVSRFLQGMRAYRAHPYRRALADPPVAWRDGTTRLLDFRPAEATRAVMLAVPSLINRAYILDLAPRLSLMRWLAGRGIRGLLVDWDAPGPEERDFDLTAYIVRRLEPALDIAHRIADGRPVVLLGYCMGGLLATALAQRRAGALRGLVLLATPWDFHAGHDPEALRGLAATARARLGTGATLPVDALQSLFLSLDPWLVLRKFSQFATLDPAGAKARAFVALEDWINDGVPLAGPVARETLAGWYGDNDPARGRWRVAGAPVRPERLELPTIAVVPAHDRIVPPDSAAALAEAIPGAEVLTPALGHIGMLVAGGARAEVWQPLSDWLLAR